MAASNITLLIFIAFGCFIHGGKAFQWLNFSVPVSVFNGEDTVLTCQFDLEGDRLYTVKWYKDIVEFYRSVPHEEPKNRAFRIKGFTVDLSESDEQTVTLRDVNLDAKGEYRCEVSTDAPTFLTYTKSYDMNVVAAVEAPQLSQVFDSETLQPGPSILLECVATGNPIPRFTWELYGNRLSSSEKIYISQQVSDDGVVVSHLNINSIHTNDGGLYTCVASSTAGFARHTERINVYGLPHIMPMEKVTVLSGENLAVNCPFAGYPTTSVIWERNGRKLPINERQTVFPNGTLIIESVQKAEDEGQYTCVARNYEGYVTYGELDIQVMDEENGLELLQRTQNELEERVNGLLATLEQMQESLDALEKKVEG